ncbi:MAG: 3'-5' exonuclease [Spirochaetaceae bacterium]|nr:3'-5' exonuclease [Spirochaetaceae bacterium]
MKRRSRISEMAKAKTWAHHLAQRDDWLVIDVETTGLGAHAEIVEVAVVSARGHALVDVMVRPRMAPEPGAVRVHGLGAGTLRGASPFEEIYGTLADLLAGMTVVAYNAEFDRQALSNTCRIAGLPPVVCTWECAMTRYEQWRGFHASLDTVCEVESIVIDGTRHRALPDATLVWRLIQRMAGRPA